MDGYFNWLLTLLDTDEYDYEVDDYVDSLYLLYTTEFTWVDPMDENRVRDVEDLRGRYDGPINRPFVSILEVMIRLAWRLNHEWLDDSIGDIFWTMMTCMGLISYPSWDFDEENVLEIVDNFLARNFDKSGQGGLFLTKNEEIDMKTLEIWNQAMVFINENYD